MSGIIELDLSDYRRFFERLGVAAGGDFKQELTVFIDGLGFEFLRILQDLIIKRKVSLSGHAERREREPRQEPAKRSSTASKSKTHNRQSEGGMILTAGKVKGSQFWEDALEVFENVYPGFLEAKLQEWLDTYFANFK